VKATSVFVHLRNFCAIVIYTNSPSGVIAYLVAMLASANKLFAAIAGDINLVAMLVSTNKLFGTVAGDINRVAMLVSVNKVLGEVVLEVDFRFLFIS
jgi:hypothetical protein